MFVKIKEEMADTLKYIQTETQAHAEPARLLLLLRVAPQARLDSEEYYNRMMDDSTNKMQAEITKECNERELSEQHFFGLLEETIAMRLGLWVQIQPRRPECVWTSTWVGRFWNRQKKR